MNVLAVALALLNPSQLYYLPDKPVTIDVDASQRLKYEVAPTKLLLLTPDGKVEAEAAFADGVDRVDLTKLLPKIWDGNTHYVQAATAENQAVGPAVVVVPLWPADRQVKAVVKEELKGKPMGLRVYVDQHVVFETTLGEIRMALAPEAAPNTVASFMHLVGGGFYDGVIFHRVAPGFVIQGGDPTGTGFGGPGYMLDLEADNGKVHERGTLSMARSGNPDSAGSQFFICLDRLTQLDPSARSRGYTTFGDVVSGMDVVDKIAALKTEGGKPDGRPVEPPMIKDAKLVAAPPRAIKAD